MIHVCYAITDTNGKYCKFLATSMLSVMSNTKLHVQFHVLCDESLQHDSREKLKAMVQARHQIIAFYDMQILAKDILSDFADMLPEQIKKRFSLAAMYRLLAFDVLSDGVQRLIYLDADTYVQDDINELWCCELEGATLGAVADEAIIELKEKCNVDREWKIRPYTYFNSGVLMMERHGWPQSGREFLELGRRLFVQYPETVGLPDQNILNEYFEGEWFHLPGKYNRLVAAERVRGELDSGYGIIHYSKELRMNFEDGFSRAFWQYFVRTPWFDESFWWRITTVIGALEEQCGKGVSWSKVISQL